MLRLSQLVHQPHLSHRLPLLAISKASRAWPTPRRHQRRDVGGSFGQAAQAAALGPSNQLFVNRLSLCCAAAGVLMAAHAVSSSAWISKSKQQKAAEAQDECRGQEHMRVSLLCIPPVSAVQSLTLARDISAATSAAARLPQRGQSVTRFQCF